MTTSSDYFQHDEEFPGRLFLEDAQVTGFCAELRGHGKYGGAMADAILFLREAATEPYHVTFKQGFWEIDDPAKDGEDAYTPNELQYAYRLAHKIIEQAEIGAMFTFGLESLGFSEVTGES